MQITLEDQYGTAGIDFNRNDLDVAKIDASDKLWHTTHMPSLSEYASRGRRSAVLRDALTIAVVWGMGVWMPVTAGELVFTGRSSAGGQPVLFSRYFT